MRRVKPTVAWVQKNFMRTASPDARLLTTYRDLSGSIFRDVIFYQLDQSANLGDVSEYLPHIGRTLRKIRDRKDNNRPSHGTNFKRALFKWR